MKKLSIPLILSMLLMCGHWAHAQSVTIHDGNYWSEESGSAGYAAFEAAAIAPSPGGNNGQNLANERDPVVMFAVDQPLAVGSILVGLKTIGTAAYDLTISIYEQDDITAAAWTPGTLLYSETFAVPVYAGSSTTGTLQLVLSGGVDLQATTGAAGYAVLFDVSSSSRAVLALASNLGDYTDMYYGRKDYTPTYQMESANRLQLGFVERVVVTGVSLDVETLELAPGESETLTATVTPAEATSPAVEWSSSDERYVTVDEFGVVTAVNKGSATVTATTADGGFTDTVAVTVTGASVTGVTASSERVSLEMGELGLLLYAKLQPEDAGNRIVTWSSDDTSVVVVSESGFLMPVGEGTATVTVTTDEGGFTDTVPVEVGSGWTEFTLHPDATIYYVSSSDGDDSNDGLTPETAFATINHGLTVIAGSDWLLMKRGDTFNEELSYWQNGISAEYPTLFGAYGDLADPRPIIDPPGSYGMQLHGGTLGAPTKRPARLDNVAFVSLHLYNSKHDPSSPNFNSSSSGGWGVSILRPGDNVLFEDVLSEYFGQWRLQADEVATLSNLTIRRSTIRNNWGGRAQGIFQAWLENLTIEECLFDHNGWNEETNTLPTIFNHNLYLASEGLDTLVRRNIIARASSHGMQLRSEGVAEQNIFLGNSIGGFVSNNSITEDRGVQILNDNVVIEGSDKMLYNEANPPVEQGARSWGIGLNYTADKSIYYGDPLEMQNNIVANGPAVSRVPYDIVSGLSNAPYKAEGNITYNWGTSSDTIPETPFPDPDRTSGSYNATLGGTATMEAYLEKVGEQRKGNWDPDYSWIGLWSYVREGFDQNTINWRPVTGVELGGDSVLNLSVGRSLALVADVQPVIASQPRVFWESSDESVATVSDYGTVNVVGAGTATISVTTMDGAFTDSVTVNAAALARFEDQIGATQTSAGSMSYESSWLGYFWADDTWGNWVYHVGLKWVNTSLVTDASSFWLWNPTLNTWTYLHADVYPWFWVLGSDSTAAPLWVQNSANCWVYFYAPESGPAQLYYSPGAQWINYEQRRF